MKVTKWEMKSEYDEQSDKLLKEGWEPFAANGFITKFRRPTGYVEVEEKIVKHNGEIKPEQIITKEVAFNLDEIFKSKKSNC